MVRIYLSALVATLAMGAPLSANAAGRVLDAASPYATLARHHTGEPAAYAAMLQRPSPRAEALAEMTAMLREVGVSGIDLRGLAAGARAHGSRYARYAPSSSAGFDDTPVDPGPPPAPIDTSGVDAANAAIQANDAMMAAQAANDAAQQQFNDGMAAALQTEINANFSQ